MGAKCLILIGRAILIAASWTSLVSVASESSRLQLPAVGYSKEGSRRPLDGREMSDPHRASDLDRCIVDKSGVCCLRIISATTSSRGIFERRLAATSGWARNV